MFIPLALGGGDVNTSRYLDQERNFLMSRQVKIFMAGFFSAVCLAALLLAVRPQAASGSGDIDAVLYKLDFVLQELRILREEVARLHESFTSSPGDVRSERADEARETSEVISELRSMKAAALMYYADNLNMGIEGLSSALLVSRNNLGNLFRLYLNDPAKYNGPEFVMEVREIDGGNIWLAGRDVSGKSEGVRRFLRARAEGAGLLSEDGSTYRGENVVYVLVR